MTDPLDELLKQQEKILKCLEAQMKINKNLLGRVERLEAAHPKLNKQEIINDGFEKHFYQDCEFKEQ